MSITTVTSQIGLKVTKEAKLAFAVAVAKDTPIESEELTITVDGEALEVEEVVDDAGARTHVVIAPEGQLQLRYEAAVTGSAPAQAVSRHDELHYVRPSRYVESDRFNVVSQTVHPELQGQELITAIGAWVREYLRYIPGTSGSEDSAIDTLLAGQGVCRDFTHLTAALLRARGIPARVCAVYAPGLIPMDLHLVTEAALDGVWQVVDSTRKAPRGSLIRIATGRDAADTAFLNILSGRISFGYVTVTAYLDGDLPVDDHTQPVSL